MTRLMALPQGMANLRWKCRSHPHLPQHFQRRQCAIRFSTSSAGSTLAPKKCRNCCEVSRKGGFKSLVLWAVLGKDTSYGMLEGRQGSGCDASSGSVKLQWSLYHHRTG
ncbi:expressed protein [Cryptococcus deneoformans JEC21]|uniref:Expressed protein n=1 Tax=Cryptococcus deneoformans (strain JEC21 / ATCC MYA-565) TaxID=214684 RepID=Q5KG16_CRYD1|nr:expressed protein [Cryptococcus neoformans var. neoformans JEC21]AAW43845.2 expressed protein [Cryptococcus neoformans var. neoformans JEC21]